MKPLILLAFVAMLTFSHSSTAEEFIPKYSPAGKPHATLLKADRSFLKTANAPDFWALIPYYEGMREGHTASAASVAMVLNGLRQKTRYSSADELITEESLLKKVTTENWADEIRGEKPKGVNLTQLGTIANAALTAYGLTHHVAEVIAAPVDKTKLAKILAANEGSDENFIIANYTQSAFTGDPEGAVGTFSPVGAFANGKKVLILETDRKYYEPYWVSFETFAGSLSAGGLLWIHKK